MSNPPIQNNPINTLSNTRSPNPTSTPQPPTPSDTSPSTLTRSLTLPLPRNPTRRIRGDPALLADVDSGFGEPRDGFSPPYTRYPGPTEIHIWWRGDGSQFPDRGPLPEGHTGEDYMTPRPRVPTPQPRLERSRSVPNAVVVSDGVVGAVATLPGGERRRDKVKKLGKRLVARIRSLGKRGSGGDGVES